VRILQGGTRRNPAGFPCNCQGCRNHRKLAGYWLTVDLDGASGKDRTLPDDWRAPPYHDDARAAWAWRCVNAPDWLSLGQPWADPDVPDSDDDIGLPPNRKAADMVSPDEMMDIIRTMCGNKHKPRT
jgi:hypothetical protein